MSLQRQPALTPADERFLLVRPFTVACAPGLRTSSPERHWHRLVAAGEGVMIVRTSQGAWSVPSASAVWVPAGVRHDLEICQRTTLRTLYLRKSRAAWATGAPTHARAVLVEPLLREVIATASALPALDRRIPWHAALATLLVQQVARGARDPAEIVWPTDERAARIASLLQARPGDPRSLPELCHGQGVSPRTAQRLFPEQTGQTFEQWRSRLRFLHAVRLLAEGRKVGSVALDCGYRSASAFVAAFRDAAGVTPAKYVRSASALAP